MSTIFESLKKLEQKENEKKPTVAKAFSEVEPKAKPGGSKNWLVSWLGALAFVFIGFAFFTYLKYQELGKMISTQQTAFFNKVDHLSRRIDGMDQKIQSMDKNTQATQAQLDRLSNELAKERDVQGKTTAQVIKLIEDRFGRMSKQIKSLEEKEEQNIPPQEVQVR